MARARYDRIIEKVFLHHYREGATRLSFDREELVSAAEQLGISAPKNLGDIIYSFRYRKALPVAIARTAAADCTWIIRSEGRGRYCFAHVPELRLQPNPNLVETKVPDATPGIIEMYALGDEQALLAKLRYNRLLDIFTGLTCYSLQNHLRTTVTGVGQVETDEIYISIDRQGVHYMLPVQAKGSSDSLGRVQFEQDLGVCRDKFPVLIPRLIGAQFVSADLIALFELEETDDGFGIVTERHYRLVAPEHLSESELRDYRKRLS